MSDSPAPSSNSDPGSISAVDQTGGRSRRSTDGSQTLLSESRHWRDVFWLGIFVIHLIGLGFLLSVLGLNRFKKTDRFNISRYTNQKVETKGELTEDYWPIYAVAGGVGALLGWMWLLLLGSPANQMLKISVHILTTYLAVISVLCFWCDQFFWGVAFAIAAALQFLYVISVIDRLSFTMLVLQKAVKMVWSLPEVKRVAYVFMAVMLLWMGIWSFGTAGVVASDMDDGGRWWLLLVLSVSLFWTGAVLCNTVHVIVSGMVFLVLIHDGRDSVSMPHNPLVKSLRYAVTTSLGSICYGSLFTAAIRTLRWEIAVYGKGFNRSARDAWELFQSTGVEALVAYDCSGAVLLMGTIVGGLITGTCAGAWTYTKWHDRVVMVGSTAMLMGMVLVGLAMVVVESAVTSIYICYAEDPLLIHRWDAEFFNQMSETLHQRLQYRSARAREVLTNNRFDSHTQESLSV
ncbi:Plasma-membrane choline transporter family protein [Citrus sinensis]|uniref:Plasma-membrane choline transporter family protein n=1 Tax=Citrus sinensis TaxID=2711 RepID=A0ACB8LEX6_CITSI|nr:Plasma-membrane choline transporter family protein [Citrus sinensis]